MNYEELNKYLLKVFNESIQMENDRRKNVKDEPIKPGHNKNIIACQYVIFNDELIMEIRSNYIRVLRRIIYRLDRNLIKNFKSLKGLNIQTNHPRLTNDDYHYDIYYIIAPHHSIARCDFFRRPSTITTYGTDFYYNQVTHYEPKEHLTALKEYGFDYETDMNLTKENWHKYTTAVRSIYGNDFKDITNCIVQLEV